MSASARGTTHPVFLVGPERAGTTLLRLMLDHHPEIAFHHEFELAVEMMPEHGEFPDITDYHAFLKTYRFAERRFEIDKSLDYPSLIQSMLEQRRSWDGKPRIGATVHLHFDRLLRIWPEASFIKLTRDARDVARSAIGMGFAGNVYHGVERWLTAEHLWERMKLLVPEARRIEVRYEALVQDPVGELGRICSWFGVEYSPTMLEYMNTERGRTYKYPDPKLSYQWKKKLTKREIQLVELRAGDMLAARGYPLSGHPIRRISRAEETALAVHNRLGIARYRLELFGPRLWAESVIAERLGGLSTWRDNVRFRVNDVINANLD